MLATQTHLAAENFLYTAGIDMVHVPYKGEGPALIDLVAGQIQFVTPNLSAAIGFVQQGKLRALAVTSKERVRAAARRARRCGNAARIREPRLVRVHGPDGTPKAVIDKIYQRHGEGARARRYAQRFEQLGMVPVGNPPDDFAQAIKEEAGRWAKIIRERKL